MQLEVANLYGHLDHDRPFLVQMDPDLNFMLENPSSFLPQEPSESNSATWDSYDKPKKQHILLIAYLQHPMSL